METRFALPRVGIARIRRKFQVIYPQGMIVELTRDALLLMLAMHRRESVVAARSYLEESFDIRISLTKATKLWETFQANNLLDEFHGSEISNIEDPFYVEQVIRNVFDESLSFLTLSDLAVFFTEKCNYFCKGCSVDAKPIATNGLTVTKIKQLIDDARRLGCVNLALTGGEPVLPEYIEMLEEVIHYARDSHFAKVVVATNGCYLPKYIDRLKAAGVTRFSISFLGLDGVMDAYVGVRYAEQFAMAAIEAVLHSSVYLGVNCVVMKGNLHQIKRIAKCILGLIEGIPHSYLRFSPLVQVGRGTDLVDESLLIEEKQGLIDRYLGLRKQYGKQIRLTCYEEIESDTPMICDAGVCYVCVGANGDIAPCDLLKGVTPMGNVFRQSLLESWQSGDWRVFRSMKPINQVCGQCVKRNSCFGKCRALSYIQRGSLSMSASPKNCPQAETKGGKPDEG